MDIMNGCQSQRNSDKDEGIKKKGIRKKQRERRKIETEEFRGVKSYPHKRTGSWKQKRWESGLKWRQGKWEDAKISSLGVSLTDVFCERIQRLNFKLLSNQRRIPSLCMLSLKRHMAVGLRRWGEMWDEAIGPLGHWGLFGPLAIEAELSRKHLNSL